jgi:hypothetical protein
MDMDHRKEIMGEMQPMAVLYNKLAMAPAPKEKKPRAKKNAKAK